MTEQAHGGGAGGPGRGRAARYRPLVRQLLLESLAAMTLAVVIGGLWSLVAAIGFSAALSRAAFLGAALWLFAGGSLFPRMTEIEHAPWSETASSEELTADPARRKPDVALSPFGSSVLVALVLLVLGLVLH